MALLYTGKEPINIALTPEQAEASFIKIMTPPPIRLGMAAKRKYDQLKALLEEYQARRAQKKQRR